MSLLSATQLAAIRSYGVLGMTTDVTIRTIGAYAADDTNPFGDDDLTVGEAYADVTVKGWVIANMGRDFEEDGSRIVAVHDLTLRVPVGTAIKERDRVFIDGTEYVVAESNTEDTWPEWTECYIKRVA